LNAKQYKLEFTKIKLDLRGEKFRRIAEQQEIRNKTDELKKKQ